MFPTSLVDVARAVVGRFALYAPRDAGVMTIWRGILADPWSPETDLLVAVPDVGNEAIFRLVVANAGPRIMVEREPLLAVRPAHRGVTLADVLQRSGEASSPTARPPLELLALLTRALDRPGLRLQRVTSPHQIVISWDGDVFVDGLDPVARAHPWATGAAGGAMPSDRADIEACLVAACARGRVDFRGARALVDEVALAARGTTTTTATTATTTMTATTVAEKNSIGVIERAICGRYAVAQGRGHELDDVVDLSAARSIVGGLVRGLFPERLAADALALEELATLGADALAHWPHTLKPPAAAISASMSAAQAEAASMRREALQEQALVATEVAALVEESRATVTAMAPIVRASLAPPRAPMLQRLGRWLSELWHSVRHRVASARVPRVLTTSARPAPTPRRRRRRRRIRVVGSR